MKSPILGGAYTARSVNAACSRMVNLFPEAIPEGGKEPAFLSRAPGMRTLVTAGNGPIRGAHKFGAYGYVVSGGSLYRLDTAFTATILGAVPGSSHVSMEDNGTQLFICSNGWGYIYEGGVVTAIADPDFPGAVTVGYIDGFFVFNEPNSQKVWVTSILDGTAIDALDFASAEASPDNLVSVKVDHREIWLFGENSTEVWYNAGGSGFPLARIQGAFLEVGCVAAHSVSKLDNSLFWLGSDKNGQGTVYRANGYTPVRVSTHAVEYAIQNYADITDAIAYSYQKEGHSFYVLTFPTADKTWVYDAATDKWHERAGFSNGLFTRHRSNCAMSFGGEIVVGDYSDGTISALDLATYADNGSTQKYLRSWRALPTGQNNLTRTFHHSLQIDCETGVGLTSGQGSDPQMDLRWSDDSGHTWSNAHSVSLGAIGKTGTRAIFRRLGSTDKLRDRVYEISGTDPVKIAIVGAELIL